MLILEAGITGKLANQQMAIGYGWISCSERASPIVVQVQLRMSCYYNTIFLKEILYSTDLSLYRLQIARMRITAARAWDNCWSWIPMQWHCCSARIWILRCCCGSSSQNWSFYVRWSRQVNMSLPLFLLLKSSKSNQFGPHLTTLDLSGPFRKSLHQFGPVPTNSDQFGSVWTSLDQFGPVWNSLKQFGTV